MYFVELDGGAFERRSLAHSFGKLDGGALERRSLAHSHNHLLSLKVERLSVADRRIVSNDENGFEGSARKGKKMMKKYSTGEGRQEEGGNEWRMEGYIMRKGKKEKKERLGRIVWWSGDGRRGRNKGKRIEK